MIVPQSIPYGPSEDYEQLLRGEITAEEYVRRLKQRVAKLTRRGAA